MGAKRKTETVAVTLPRGIRLKHGKIYIRTRRFPGRGDEVCTGESAMDASAIERWGVNWENMLTMVSGPNGMSDDQFAAYFRDRPTVNYSITFAELVAQWKEYLPTKRNKKSRRPLAQSTIDYYLEYMRVCWTPAFSDVKGKALISWDISKVTADTINEVIESGHLAAMQPQTVGKYCSALKQMFKWAQHQKLVAVDPSASLGASSSNPVIDPRKVFKVSEIDRLLDECRRQAEHMYRDNISGKGTFELNKEAGELYYNYFEFCFLTGMRPAEVIALRVRDLDLEASRIYVKNALVLKVEKGTKNTNVTMRRVPLMPRAVLCVKRQLEIVGTDPEQHLFVRPVAYMLPTDPLSERTTPFPDQLMQYRVWCRANDAVFPERAPAKGEDRDRPPYTTRHTSVSLQLKIRPGRRNEIALSHGHSQKVMEQVYTHFVDEDDDNGEDNSPAIQRIRVFYGLPPVEMTGELYLRRLEKLEARNAELEQQLVEARNPRRKAA